METRYTLTRKTAWSDIEEIKPDDWDLAMMKEIEENPEEHTAYISQEQLMAELGL